jgi:hypothetical protein
MHSTGPPNSVAVGYPRRFAPRRSVNADVTQREGQSVFQSFCIKTCLACVCRGSCSTLPSNLKLCSAGTRERAGGVQMYSMSGNFDPSRSLSRGIEDLRVTHSG